MSVHAGCLSQHSFDTLLHLSWYAYVLPNVGIAGGILSCEGKSALYLLPFHAPYTPTLDEAQERTIAEDHPIRHNRTTIFHSCCPAAGMAFARGHYTMGHLAAIF